MKLKNLKVAQQLALSFTQVVSLMLVLATLSCACIHRLDDEFTLTAKFIAARGAFFAATKDGRLDDAKTAGRWRTPLRSRGPDARRRKFQGQVRRRPGRSGHRVNAAHDCPSG